VNSGIFPAVATLRTGNDRTVKVRIGSSVPVLANGDLSPLTRGDAIVAVGAAGLDHLMVGDHVSFFGGAGADGLIQAAASLGCRPDLQVFVGVYLLGLRHPVPVARQVADIASMAPGKLVLGVGLGGEDRHEVEVCGVDPVTRGRRTDECLAVLRGLLAGDAVTFSGRHIQVADALIRPAPARPVPIIVGGRSDAAIARAARTGDGWLGIWVSARRFAEAVRAVETQADAYGRSGQEWTHGLNVWCGLGQTREVAQRAVAQGMQDFYHLPYESFARWSPAGTPDDVAEFLAPYIEAGCSMFNLIPCGEDSDETVAMAAEVRDLLRREFPDARP
jgi:alkanesulfonate monooxygenase SsuD/methylene tetrahydromethanopterin reductase-like flavin-dependent oxidoreductase (luciferase family)